MALISCSECRKEISDTAQSCPGCGAPARAAGDFNRQHVEKKPKTRPAFKVLGALLLVLFALPFLGILKSQPKEDAVAAEVASTGFTSPASPASPPAQSLKLSAAKLAGDYEANEVAADIKYKGKWLEIKGVVGSVNKDFADAVWVGIDGGSNPFMPIHAEGIDAQKAAALTKGDRITVTCIGGGMIVGSPILRSCVQ